MTRFRRSHASGLALETIVPHERAFRRSLSDEVAIDFPSSSAAIACLRRDHIESGEPTEPCTLAEITVSACQADTGAMVPLDLHVPRTCATCGGRGEVWSERCEPCHGQGHELHYQRLTVSVPAGVEHGDRFSFNVSLPRGPRTRVDVRVAVIELGA
jgi:DnaJ-class molecular chaperone